jgi:hypothetical protein
MASLEQVRAIFDAQEIGLILTRIRRVPTKDNYLHGSRKSPPCLFFLSYFPDVY